MKPGQPFSLKDVLDPKIRTIETVESSTRPFEPEAKVDGFSFATHSVGRGPRRRLGFWFKLVAWIFLGWTALGLIVEAVSIAYSLLQT